MPNAIKYNVSAETLALKKGNFWIGTGDVGKGPTSSTGFYNGLTPPSGGFTIYLNKATGGPSIYTVNTEAQLTALTNSISVSTNLIKNNNGGNFADGTRAPFNYPYPAQTFPTVFDVSNDKPYVGSSTKYALKFTSGLGVAIYSEPSPFTMTAGIVYTFSFWYKQTNSNQGYIQFNNQGGSGDINGNFYAASDTGNFPNPTQTWQRCSWTITNVINKVYLIMTTFNSATNAEILMTEFTLTEGSMPGGPGLTTSGNCLNWFGSVPTDKMIFNRDYESIVSSGLTLNLDAGFSPSFATIPLNKNSSTVTPWYDLSENGNNGTLINGLTYSPTGGGSIVFDGVDDYVLTSLNASSFTSFNMSLGLWFNTKTIKNNTFTLLSGARAGNDSYNPLGIFIETRDSWAGNYSSKPGIVAISNYPRYVKSAPNTIANDTWYYVVQTATETQTRLYINGTLVDIAMANTTLYTSSPYYFGVGSYGNYGTYPGTTQYSGNYSNQNIAVTQIYNRALTASEVSQNYNALKGRFGLS